MEDKGKTLSVQIMELLKPILPPNVGFLMIVADPTTDDMGLTSNMSDEAQLFLLQSAAETIVASPPESLELLEPEKDKTSN